ncbi:MAG: metallophosphoesterase family protein [Spirochaetales bacterium]|nr:metallophosphoesterase family protein [Spirochaetales bacterium]
MILSDIHANLESLSLLAEKYISHLNIDKIICLGDIVGYNADPAACISLVIHNLKAITIRGNHDRAVAYNNFDFFSDHARMAGIWTRNNLSPEHIDDLAFLDTGPEIIDTLFAICHGAPTDEDKYILSPYQSTSEFSWLQRNGINVCFFGHTHMALSYVCNKYADMNNPAHIKTVRDNRIRIEADKYYLINPGSLGQPRDGNPDACFALFDTKTMVVEIIRFPYLLENTQKKIIEKKIPHGSYLASRLAGGY